MLWTDFLGGVGMVGLYHIAITLLFIGLSFWCLQMVNFDVLLRNPRSMQAKLLQIILSIVLGHNLAKFVYDYSNWASMLKWLF